MVQFLENKKMIFHFMDVDYFLLLLLKKLFFLFQKPPKNVAVPSKKALTDVNFEIQEIPPLILFIWSFKVI